MTAKVGNGVGWQLAAAAPTFATPVRQALPWMKISVVIPCFNVEAFIGRCLESIEKQSHPDLEIICVNDGSTDKTSALLAEFAAHSERPVRVLDQPNAGASAARNAAAALATGTYIQFMDADDALHPTKLSHQAALAETRGLPALIVGSFRTLDPTGRVVATVVQHTSGRAPWLDLMRHRLGGTPQNLWLRSMVEKVGGWDPALGSSQEYDLMFRMLQQGAEVLYDDAVLTDVHQREGGSISQGNMERNWKRFVDLRIRILDHLRRAHPGLELAPYQQMLFDSIRTLYPFAPAVSVEMYRTHLPPSWKPSRSPATGKGYLLLHKLLGFALANRVRSWFNR
jgi:glycosyltransferase involved in cell wall biosynthesis